MSLWKPFSAIFSKKTLAGKLWFPFSLFACALRGNNLLPNIRMNESRFHTTACPQRLFVAENNDTSILLITYDTYSSYYFLGINARRLLFICNSKPREYSTYCVYHGHVPARTE